MDFNENQTIEDWFYERKIKDFPKNFDYIDHYCNGKKRIRKYIQNNTNIGAIESERKKGKYESSLTDHNFGHYDMLIIRITDLLKSEWIELTPYEVFILLMATQIHDIGNILGRTDHIANTREVFFDVLGTDMFSDSTESSIFLNIAEAHSGEIGGEKDVIGKLPLISRHKDTMVRNRLLSAILRFADELSEGPERASQYLMQKGLIAASSEIYHQYSQSLTSTIIDVKNQKITLTYNFTKDLGMKRYQKNGKKVFLLDEIFIRNIKTYLEFIYCMKFFRQSIILDRINVEISIFSKKYIIALKTIKYRIVEKGYPEYPKNGIIDIIEGDHLGLYTKDNKIISGSILKSQLEEMN